MTEVSYSIANTPAKFEATVMTSHDSETYFKIVCDPGHERTARELRQLPRESRERVWADMTGDPNTTYYSINPEEAAFVVDKLHEMHVEVQRIQIKPAYDLAFQMSPEYVNDPAFLLMFLRSDNYDASLAAQRLVGHLEQKLVLFGKEKLAVTITMRDLSEDDLETLSCGGLQLLPCKDRGGRLIMMGRYSEFVFKKRENMHRALWYMLMTAVEDPEVQKKGLIHVGYEVGDYIAVDFELIRQLFRCVRILPVRVVACHSCYSVTPMQKVVDLVVHMLSSFMRLRFRFHNGSHQECLYRLFTVGIPVNYLPVSPTGDLKLDNHKRWLSFRLSKEAHLVEDDEMDVEN